MTSPTSRLSDHTALVTGAASGIGRACATALGAAGVRLVLLDRDAEQLTDVATATGGRPVVADLGDPGVVDTLDLGEPDILVNNAGIQHVSPIEEFDPDTFALIQRVMVEAPFRLLRRLLPSMYAREWGRIVNISSVHGHRASPYKSAYVAAKHGLEGLSKVVALEGAERGVTSNTICPGYVRTPLVENQLADQAEAHGINTEQVLGDVLLARTPVKRLVEPDEVARLAVFLCTPGSESLTGSSFMADGGWTAA
jgi:3-hydroxybutyrate dehydrogenase